MRNDNTKNFKFLRFIFWHVDDLDTAGVNMTEEEREKFHLGYYLKRWEKWRPLFGILTDEENEYIKYLGEKYGYQDFLN